MATNFYFRSIDYDPEQELMQDLADEMIQIFGIDVYYIIRSTMNIDSLLEEAPTSEFNTAVPIEMYINSYEGFSGEGDLLTKFGLSIADKLTLSVSRRRFAEDIGTPYDLYRPQEGDLVYFPLSKGIFEIKFVEHEAQFYQAGALQSYELQLEKFNYSSERFNTGIAAIDQTETKYSTADSNFEFATEQGNNFIAGESGGDFVNENFNLDDIDPMNQNKVFQNISNTFIDFSLTNPFSEHINDPDA